MKIITKTTTLILMSILLISFPACKKELDLDADIYYGIKEFYDSKNCKTDCGEQAPCEGRTVKLEGLIDASSIQADALKFSMKDKDTGRENIEIKVAQEISDKVFDSLIDQGGKTVRVKGLVKGFDMKTNFSCNRGFSILLEEFENLQVTK